MKNTSLDNFFFTKCTSIDIIPNFLQKFLNFQSRNRSLILIKQFTICMFFDVEKKLEFFEIALQSLPQGKIQLFFLDLLTQYKLIFFFTESRA